MEKQKYEQEEINKSNEEIWNKQKFDKAFEKELTNWEISDHKAFWEMISWENFNENNNWQKNLENAYLSKIWAEIDKLDNLSDEEQNHITAILANDYEINNIEKAIDDIMQSYEKDKLNERKFQILEMLETPIEENQKKELEKELSEIIIHLAKIK